MTLDAAEHCYLWLMWLAEGGRKERGGLFRVYSLKDTGEDLHI